MTKKLARNKFRDAIGDYYKTNRQITKEADEEYKKQKEQGQTPWNTREKSMLLITGVLVILLVIRYMFF
jgi:hypothetical protein